MKKDSKINFRIAVKGFIAYKKKLFIIKRSKKDVQSPSIWELPGGRLELGEDPILGLMREIREETGIYVEVIHPLGVRHFKRDDGQRITMIIFLCKPKRGGQLKLSEEHSKCGWIDLKKSKKKLTGFFHQEVDIFYRLNLKRLLR